MRCVTSFSEAGYSQYGKSFLETYLKFVSKPIMVYTEEGFSPDIKDDLIECRSLEDVPGFKEYIGWTGKIPATQGKLWGNQYNYNFDTHKFCRKSFAQIDAASEGPNRLYWLDADIEFNAPFELPEFDGFMCYLGRPEWHSCASLVGWNLEHHSAGEFFQRYWLMHVTGTILALEGWTDCHALDWLREQTKVPAKNLAEGLDLKGPANVFDEVFKAAHHKKGGIKRFRNRYEELIAMIAKQRPSRILEIGTWNGIRAIEMCQFGAEYVGFDLFDEATSKTDSEEMNVKPHHSMGEVWERLCEAGVKAKLIKGNTRNTLPLYEGEPFDFAFIDGGHSVETIKSDWENVKRLMAPGGVVVFDDYYEGDIDTEKFGANKIVESLDYSLGSRADPVKGGGTTRLAVVRT